MNLNASILLTASVLTAHAPAIALSTSAEVDAEERDALRELERQVNLESLRAGDFTLPEGLQDADREALRRLERANAAIGEQRAGDLHLNNNELLTILLVLGIVVAVAILV